MLLGRTANSSSMLISTTAWAASKARSAGMSTSALSEEFPDAARYEFGP